MNKSLKKLMLECETENGEIEQITLFENLSQAGQLEIAEMFGTILNEAIVFYYAALDSFHLDGAPDVDDLLVNPEFMKQLIRARAVFDQYLPNPPLRGYLPHTPELEESAKKIKKIKKWA